MLVSFVIPCYHSEQTLGAVVAEIDGTMKTMPGYTWEIICVNDGTPNACWKKIQELCAEKPDSRHGICLARNFGQHAAQKSLRAFQPGHGLFFFLLIPVHTDVYLAGLEIRGHNSPRDSCHHIDPRILYLSADHHAQFLPHRFVDACIFDAVLAHSYDLGTSTIVYASTWSSSCSSLKPSKTRPHS